MMVSATIELPTMPTINVILNVTATRTATRDSKTSISSEISDTSSTVMLADIFHSLHKSILFQKARKLITNQLDKNKQSGVIEKQS
jgi:hypothetical protein